jgi:hypothetical protein
LLEDLVYRVRSLELPPARNTPDVTTLTHAPRQDRWEH